jgi:transcriptional/translational regulatory protein YebC/TACO1
VEFEAAAASDDAMLEGAIEAGADDVASDASGHVVTCAQAALNDVSAALEARFGAPRKSGFVWRPQTNVAVDDEAGEKLVKLMGLLDDHDDVQNVYSNFEISDALMSRMSG